MNPRTTAILFVVAAVVVGLVWWNENVRKADVEAAEAEARELFPDVDAADVAWVALETTDGQTARLERQDGELVLVEPIAFPADDTTVEGVVSALAQTRSEGVIEAPQEASVYGLGDDAFTVRFGAGEAEHVLRIGAKTPVGGATYAATGEGEGVYTIPTFRASALRRSLQDLREKRVLRFDPQAIGRIELSWDGAGVTLERGDAGWRVTAPVEDAADEEAVEGLLSDLSFLRAEGFIDEPPPDAEVGLDRPAFEAKLVAPGEGEDAERRVFHLVLGRELEDGRHRAARGRERALYRVPSERLDDFPRRVAAYRFKELSRFVASDARQLELAFHEPDGRAHVVVAERGDGGWVSSPEELAPGRAARIVAELAGLRAQDIVAESMGEAELEALDLAPPRVRLRVRGAGTEDEPGPVLGEVLLGEMDPELGIVAKSADSGRVYRLPFEQAEHLPVSLEALRNRFLSKEDEGDAGAGLPPPGPHAAPPELPEGLRP